MRRTIGPKKPTTQPKRCKNPTHMNERDPVQSSQGTHVGLTRPDPKTHEAFPKTAFSSQTQRECFLNTTSFQFSISLFQISNLLWLK